MFPENGHMHNHHLSGERFCSGLGFFSFWKMFISLFNFSIVTQFLFPSISPGIWQMHCLVWRRQTLGKAADASCRIERSTSGGVSSVLICHKCPLFPMAKDKGQRTYEEHAFLMWHPHQIHHSGLSRMPRTLYSSSNYSETSPQYECKLWRAHLPLTWQTPNSSSLVSLNLWTLCWRCCSIWLENNVVFSEIFWSVPRKCRTGGKVWKTNHQSNVRATLSSLCASCEENDVSTDSE